MKIGALGLLTSCLLLTGCGGAGDGIATTTPPPPPPPPATPLPLVATSSFQTITATMSYNEPYGGIASFDLLKVEGRSSAVTFGYDATSHTYTVQGNGLTASFGQSDQLADTTYNDTFAKTTGPIADSIKLYGNARADTQGTPPVELSYTSFGVWTHSDSTTGKSSKTYFLYGQPTGTTMPTTGTATYQMTAAAHEYPGGVGTATTRVVGSATLNANFGAGTVDAVLKLGSSISGTGTISGDQFTGVFKTTDPSVFNGTFVGGFFGPGAKEAGFTFQLHYHASDPYAGATIQPLDTYIAGAAAGPKG